MGIAPRGGGIDTYTYKEAGRRGSFSSITGLTEEIPPDHTTQQANLKDKRADQQIQK